MRAPTTDELRSLRVAHNTGRLLGAGTPLRSTPPGPLRQPAPALVRPTSRFAGAHHPWNDRCAKVPGLIIAAVVFFVFVGCAQFTAWVSSPDTAGAAFWSPAGVSVAALLLLPARRWMWVIAAAIAAQVINDVVLGHPALGTLFAVFAITVEPLIAVVLLSRFLSGGQLSPVKSLARLMLSAVLVAPFVGALFGATGVALVSGGSWPAAAVQWWVSSGLGVLVLTPFLLTFTGSRWVAERLWEAALLSLLVALATGASFFDWSAQWSLAWPVLSSPLLIWSGLRFGMRGSTLAGLVIAQGANVATAFDRGPFAAVVDPAGYVVTLLQMFLIVSLLAGHVVAALVSDLAEREDVQRLLIREATHDSLTGLPNRALFTERLTEALDARMYTSTTVAVLLIDLDNFKKINDTSGHPVGDQVLVAAAKRFSESMRPDDMIARLGGDEFVVLCSHVDDADVAHAVGARLLNILYEPFKVGDREMHLSASIGVVVAMPGENHVTGASMLRNADIALYRTKRNGRAGVSMYDAELALAEVRRIDIEEELRGALLRDEMFLEFQPVVDLRSGAVASFESLLRWDNRSLGRVNPDEFIPIAEESGLIEDIGRWVLTRACEQAAVWIFGHLDTGLTIAVNVSARQLADRSFPAFLETVLHDTKLPAAALCLELTETAVMQDGGASVLLLDELKEIGVTLSIDDFGTGYSSLSYLRRFPVDSLKIDRSFVEGLGESSAIVDSVVGLAYGLGVDVIAEGIETAEQRDELIRLGCHFGQGFLWSVPVGPHDACQLMDVVFDVGSETFGSDLGRRRVHDLVVVDEISSDQQTLF